MIKQEKMIEYMLANEKARYEAFRALSVAFKQVNSYMKSHNEYANLDPYSFYVALNMMYSDYYSPNKTTDTYAMLAKYFLVDKDAPKDKLKRYLEAMHS